MSFCPSLLQARLCCIVDKIVAIKLLIERWGKRV